ncbi:MAG: FtsQ-type POTRA domain-containing protein [Sphingomonadaceae bacterium]|uniref:cell division protein FtsQ/DivIB n=1 Tax=Thermaurantiacus sp. TaxID=2820283 RepID=UPI00298F04A7|nr:cell division protein FtsQ/DivIB [Thermaurantiacus sp.]MCS6986922.1 FtsQ-type POTRA domain-containing protein [Sphingomonadaceae bacterium]MDW8415478.1 FtsQ-type POTRA domain-containing protein [Thermaurantiacus sp.]
MNRAPSFTRPAAVARPTARRLDRRGWVVVGTVLALTGGAAVLLEAPRRVVAALAHASARAGLAVRQIELSGLRHQPRLPVFEAILSGGTDSMLLFSPARVRQRLLGLTWVRDAEVRRRWPDTVVVTITERVPLAIWQWQGRYHLIDERPDPLPMVDDPRLRALPLVAGAGANRAAPELLRWLARHPRLAEGLVGATRVGGRRWDLTMATGEVVSLPEDRDAAEALRRFAALDRTTPVLGQGFRRIDLRVPGRMTVRLSPEARAEAERRRSLGQGAQSAAANGGRSTAGGAA